jgi:hypothetical protein
VIVSAMVESRPEAWREIVKRIEDTGGAQSGRLHLVSQ